MKLKILFLTFIALAIGLTAATTAVFKQQGLHEETCPELATQYRWTCPEKEVVIGRSAWECRGSCSDGAARPCYEMEERKCYCCYA